ncbi:MAG: amidase [Hyphomicrobiaceae bacterium]
MTMWLGAAEIAAGVRERRLRAADVAASALARVAASDGRIHAFLGVSPQAVDDAAAVDLATERRSGLLAGVPVAIKDLTDTAGLTTTYGSLAFRDHMPAEDDLVVARLKQAGAVVIGKTMTPEFGFGAICANALKPATCNPWDLTLTSGGSSGGSAAAVAAGVVPLAHGTDFGGSVRTPASFCGVLSLRPTPGAIPSPKRGLAFDTLATHGVLARTVADLALFMDAVAGPDPRDPTSLRASTGQTRPAAGLRFAATEDFGVAPVSQRVRAAFRASVAAVEGRFGPASWRTPDCTGAIAAFKTLRQPIIRHSYAALIATHGDALSPTVRWAMGQGEAVTAADYLAAEARRSGIYRNFVSLFEACDVLLAPAASVMPWPNTTADVTEIDGRPLATVIDYLAVTFIVSMAGCPVVTLPAWTAGDLPFGIQLIGAPGSDRQLLAYADEIAGACGFSFRPPPGW